MPSSFYNGKTVLAHWDPILKAELSFPESSELTVHQFPIKNHQYCLHDLIYQPNSPGNLLRGLTDTNSGNLQNNPVRIGRGGARLPPPELNRAAPGLRTTSPHSGGNAQWPEALDLVRRTWPVPRSFPSEEKRPPPSLPHRPQGLACLGGQSSAQDVGAGTPGSSFSVPDYIIEFIVVRNLLNVTSVGNLKYISSLKAHLRIHTVPQRIHTCEKPYECKECGKAFHTASYLVIYKRIHSGEKTFVCQELWKAFSYSYQLTIHYGVHSGEKSYECKECGKTFGLCGRLTRHQTTHSCKKRFECNKCGKAFTCIASLKKYQSIHTGEKHYECKECGKSFHLASTLVTHDRIHTGEKSYHHNECGEAFGETSC
ncbi:zinc finger protein OZF-like [Delphinapterus leucas]|uniref:Zinc finger protein OZF-like n=1 Tax=Delphinapterus leucas TaxID=9749 RepID=A0A7F8K747_DELLE|nr:zinc finger protein OZF-like [Delphinapterus leucas]